MPGAVCGPAGYDTEMFGVHYKTLYLAGGPVDDAALMEEHRFVYENTFSADKYHKYVRIPFDPKAAPGPKVPGSSKAENADLLEKEALL